MQRVTLPARLGGRQVSKEAKKQAREQNAARQAHLRNLEEQRDDLRRQAEAPRPAASAGDSERVTAKKRKLAEHREAVAALEQKRNEVSDAPLQPRRRSACWRANGPVRIVAPR